MSLRSLTLPPLLNTSDHDLIQDFCAPALAQALRYGRDVGTFASGWLCLASQGMAAGVARLCYNAGSTEWLEQIEDPQAARSAYRPRQDAGGDLTTGVDHE